jgi:hypothetical protein
MRWHVRSEEEPVKRRLAHLFAVLTLATSLLVAVTPAALAAADVEPTSVTLVGSLQDELGCPGDWQPDCGVSGLAYSASDGVWSGSFALPAGSWEYKVAIDGTWDEAYPGGNVPLVLAAPTTVTFYYDHGTHTVTDDLNAVIVTAPGDFQDELGCPGDWQPECMRSWLQDPDGDGVHVFTTQALPAGSYEGKVAHGRSWDENYGAGGVPGGGNIPFSVGVDEKVTFTYDIVTHLLTVTTEPAPPPGSPDSVTIAGSLQSEAGCAGDWDPSCGATHLTYDFEDALWQGVFDLPAGSYATRRSTS